MLIPLNACLSLLLITAVQSLYVQHAQERCDARPQRDGIEEILGKPVECPSNVKDGVCYRKNESFVILHLESSGRIKSIFISDPCNGIQGVRALVDSLVQKSSRGEIFTKPSIPKPGPPGEVRAGGCEITQREEYECLTMDYRETICQNCAPASVNVVWK
jgi:hypothetical protein